MVSHYLSNFSEKQRRLLPSRQLGRAYEIVILSYLGLNYGIYIWPLSLRSPIDHKIPVRKCNRVFMPTNPLLANLADA